MNRLVLAVAICGMVVPGVTRDAVTRTLVTQVPASRMDVDLAVAIESVRTSPDPPAFGEIFDLIVTFRIPPGTVVFLADTLIPAEAAESMGPGSWRAGMAGGDSVRVVATYPVIGYREDRVGLPSMEVWLVPPAAATGRTGATGATGAVGAIDAAVRGAGETSPPSAAERIVVRLGAVNVGQLAAMADSGAVLVARPPLDVIGGDWSPWLLLLAGVSAVAGVGGAGWLGARWWPVARRRFSGSGESLSPRAAALAELDRLRAREWHRTGRIDEFHAAMTDILREYSATIDPAWRGSLTSTELLARLEERWGGEALGPLTSAVHASERAKFSAERSTADAAEADWSAIRTWVGSMPDA